MSATPGALGRWRGRRVLITGDTGFKGAWLSLLLTDLGADVVGLGLLPQHPDGLYARCGLASRIRHHTVDIRDTAGVEKVMRVEDPEVVFHLAAQALVSQSFRDPLETFDINVVGTASVLHACGATDPAVVLVVTSDKVYANDESGRAFVESDRLGAGDPYSTSKAAAELVVESWRRSFLTTHSVLATARAGNVIGGGDRAQGRLLPDIFRALATDGRVEIRHPDAVRPWQFVLEPVAGYVMFAEHLLARADVPLALNFGPDPNDAWPVRRVVEAVIEQWGGGSWAPTDAHPGPEAELLVLDAGEARRAIGWRPLLDIPTALAWTTEWYRRALTSEDCLAMTLDQIERYRSMVNS